MSRVALTRRGCIQLFITSETETAPFIMFRFSLVARFILAFFVCALHMQASTFRNEAPPPAVGPGARRSRDSVSRPTRSFSTCSSPVPYNEQDLVRDLEGRRRESSLSLRHDALNEQGFRVGILGASAPNLSKLLALKGRELRTCSRTGRLFSR